MQNNYQSRRAATTHIILAWDAGRRTLGPRWRSSGNHRIDMYGNVTDGTLRCGVCRLERQLSSPTITSFNPRSIHLQCPDLRRGGHIFSGLFTLICRRSKKGRWTPSSGACSFDRSLLTARQVPLALNRCLVFLEADIRVDEVFFIISSSGISLSCL